MSSYFAVLVSIMAVHAIAMISPGPNFFIVTQTAISHSRRNGVFVAFGIACAAALWSSAALLGLNLLFERASWLYQGVRVLGGAYLLYLGVQSWHYASHPLAVTAKVLVTPSGWQSFRTGFITNLTNPKSVVFFGGMFAALLPPDLPEWMRAAAVGVIVFDALWWHTTLALTFSTRRAQGLYARAKRIFDYFTGGILMMLGVRLMFSRQ